jgi:uncharacterized SAM-binding protein YcdF (DUF218 family)
VVAGLLVLFLASVPVVSNWIFADLEKDNQRLQLSDVPNADAIVVLSYGMYWVKAKQDLVAEWTDPDRFLGGIELFKAGKAATLVFTKGKYSWQAGDETEGDVLKHYAQMMGVPNHQILLSDVAENTQQEAEQVRKILPSRAKIILVTSAFHLPRAKRLFQQAGFDVFGYPVDIKTQEAKLTPMSFFPTAGALAGTHLGLQEHFARLYYWLKSDYAGVK